MYIWMSKLRHREVTALVTAGSSRAGGRVWLPSSPARPLWYLDLGCMYLAMLLY